MSELSVRRTSAQKALLDAFSDITGLPVGLWELRNGESQVIYGDDSLDRFEPYCQFIRSLDGGLELCKRDECLRGEQVRTYDLARPPAGELAAELILCFAGMYNVRAPIYVNGEVRAVLSFGELQVEDAEYEAVSLQKHAQAVQALGLSLEQAEELRRLLSEAKKRTPAEIERMKVQLPRVEEWFYTLIEEEDRLRRNTEKITHEVQTRLQAVIANAENLTMEIAGLSAHEAVVRAQELLNNAMTLDTVMQNLSENLEEYRFRPHSLIPMLADAKGLYAAEAARCGIDIQLTVHAAGRTPSIEVDERHMQLALNNLMHNAVKYSFRGGPGRQRYVRVDVYSEPDHYRISFENYGVGILPEEIAGGDIFRDGYQGRLTEGEYRTGSGKGLYFVKRVVDRHSGRIVAESERRGEQGGPEGQPHLNRFTLYLPYVQPKEPKEG